MNDPIGDRVVRPSWGTTEGKLISTLKQCTLEVCQSESFLEPGRTNAQCSTDEHNMVYKVRISCFFFLHFALSRLHRGLTRANDAIAGRTINANNVRADSYLPAAGERLRIFSIMDSDVSKSALRGYGRCKGQKIRETTTRSADRTMLAHRWRL